MLIRFDKFYDGRGKRSHRRRRGRERRPQGVYRRLDKRRRDVLTLTFSSARPSHNFYLPEFRVAFNMFAP